MARLSVINNGKLVRSITLAHGETFIGRGEDVGIQLKHPLISRKHALVFLTPGGFVVEDQGTKNGTFLAGRRIQKHRLEDGDELEIADFILRYHSDGFIAAGNPSEPAGNMTAGDRGKNSKQKSPLEAYMEALKRGGTNATAAIPPMAMAQLRAQARRKATPRLKVDDGEPKRLEQKTVLIGWSKDCDVRLFGWWLWVGKAVALERTDVSVKLRKLSWFVPVKVGGEKMKGREVEIEFGKEIMVGKSKLVLMEGDISV